MTISMDNANRLRDAGFLEWEIQQIAEARDPTGKAQPPIDLDSPAWQRTLLSRQSWRNDKVDSGWSFDEIEGEIMSYYSKSPNRNPFDFLKAEYKPPLKKDYIEGVRQRAQRRIKASLPGYG